MQLETASRSFLGFKLKDDQLISSSFSALRDSGVFDESLDHCSCTLQLGLWSDQRLLGDYCLV